jgi:DNA modification methylase
MLEVNKTYNVDWITGLKLLDNESVNCCVTSPPYYGLRDYGVDGQIGLERTPEEYIQHLVTGFHEVRRVIKDDGTLWVNIADSYAGSGKGAWKNKNGQKETYVLSPGDAPTKMPKVFEGIKPKDMIGIPWMLAFALRADGWYLRQDIIWSKSNPMPESVRDRCTKSHEYIFLFSKTRHYYFDHEAIKEPIAAATVQRMAQNIKGQKGSNRANGGAKTNGTMHAVIAKGNSKSFRGGGAYTQGKSFNNSTTVERQTHGNVPNETWLRNKRSVWTVATAHCKEAHFATFPPDLIEPCILSGSREDGIILDPFMGSGTTGMVAANRKRNYIGFELNSDYCKMATKRIESAKAAIDQPTLFDFMDSGKERRGLK